MKGVAACDQRAAPLLISVTDAPGNCVVTDRLTGTLGMCKERSTKENKDEEQTSLHQQSDTLSSVSLEI